MPSTTHSPEAALLIALVKAGASLDPATTVVASEGCDWHQLLRTAAWHGVVPLVASALVTERCQATASVREEMEAYRATAVKRAFVLATETIRLQSAMAAHGVEALAWKGPSLAVQLYPEPWLRDAVDLDFLVPASDLRRAESASIAAGFTRLTGPWAQREVQFWERCTRDVKLRRMPGGIDVELHDSFMNRSFPEWQGIAEVMRRRTAVKLCGRTVETLSPEDLIISLCAHGMTHGWERLKWICDVAAFLKIQRDRLDWAALLENCNGRGSGRALLLGVTLAADVLGAEVPVALHAAVARDHVLSRLRVSIAERIRSGRLEMLKGWTLAETCALTIERRGERGRYLLHRLVQLTDEDLDYCSLPGSLFYLRYPLRAWRLLGERLRGFRELHAGQA